MKRKEDETFNAIAEILVDILDIDSSEIMPTTYLIRDLGVESIDLMELAVSLNEEFDMDVDEDQIFLKSLRTIMQAAGSSGSDTANALGKAYPFLTNERILEMIDDVDQGPVLKVMDLVQYIRYRQAAET